jgi:hypothetical protein
MSATVRTVFGISSLAAAGSIATGTLGSIPSRQARTASISSGVKSMAVCPYDGEARRSASSHYVRLSAIKVLASWQPYCKEFLAGPAEEWWNLQMGEHSFSSRSGDSEIIAKLISAGYLQPEQRNDPDAIADAIARMKLDLRARNGSDDSPAA